jgi:peptide-methionine (S)-S-oxide reductase
MLFMRRPEMPTAAAALPGRPAPIATAVTHFLNGRALKPPYPDGIATVLFGMGCFWGAERKFWSIDGVWVTAVGYAGGFTGNPTYEEVCSGRTGHTEVVLVAYDPSVVAFERLLTIFWENHDPTQGMRQGNDVGTQYRSAVFASDDRRATVEASRAAYAVALGDAGLGAITTEIGGTVPFYFAEAYHQQYLAKNPNGYCGLGGTGVSCPTATAGIRAGA